MIILKKKKTTITVISCIFFVCLFSLTFGLKRICVKTISKNYMNTVITNQIIDFVIDNYTDLTNEQLKLLQKDIINSHSLYHFNESIFDEMVYSSLDGDFQIDNEVVNQFSNCCIELIENHFDTQLKVKQKTKTKNMVKEDLLENRLTKNMYNLLQKESLFTMFYRLCDSLISKIIIFILILCHLVYLFKNHRELFLLDIFIIFLFSSLIHYIFLFLTKMATPLLADLLNLQSLTICIDDILYGAMTLLMMSLLLFVYWLKKGIYE